MQPPPADPKRDWYGRDEAFVERLRPFLQFLYHDYFRVEVTGAAFLPVSGRAMMVANHSGTLPYDGAMLAVAVFNEASTPRAVRFLIDDFAFRLPLLGTFLRRIGGLPASRENATELLKRGELIAVFPEGVAGVGKLYDERYRLQRFGHGGFVKVAIRTRTTVLPTAIIGAEEIHPLIWKSELFAASFGLPYIPFTPTFPWLGPLGLVPLPTKWRIIFGKPVSFARAKPADAENEKFVAQKTEEIRKTIQRMIDSALTTRQSVWY